MLQSLQPSKRVRKNFGKIKLVASIPNLIEIQKKSYEDSFLQLHLSENERSNRSQHRLQTPITSLIFR